MKGQDSLSVFLETFLSKHRLQLNMFTELLVPQKRASCLSCCQLIGSAEAASLSYIASMEIPFKLE